MGGRLAVSTAVAGSWKRKTENDLTELWVLMGTLTREVIIKK